VTDRARAGRTTAARKPAAKKPASRKPAAAKKPTRSKAAAAVADAKTTDRTIEWNGHTFTLEPIPLVTLAMHWTDIDESSTIMPTIRFLRDLLGPGQFAQFRKLLPSEPSAAVDSINQLVGQAYAAYALESGESDASGDS
jgi:hypothetical protein